MKTHRKKKNPFPVKTIKTILLISLGILAAFPLFSMSYSFQPKRKLNGQDVTKPLIQSGGNKAKAARILGVGRATLYRFLSDRPDLQTF